MYLLVLYSYFSIYVLCSVLGSIQVYINNNFYVCFFIVIKDNRACQLFTVTQVLTSILTRSSIVKGRKQKIHDLRNIEFLFPSWKFHQFQNATWLQIYCICIILFIPKLTSINPESNMNFFDEYNLRFQLNVFLLI